MVVYWLKKYFYSSNGQVYGVLRRVIRSVWTRLEYESFICLWNHKANCRSLKLRLACKNWCAGVAAIAQWICLHLPSCRPEFESQAHHLCFYLWYICHVKRTKINKKRPGLAHLKKQLVCLSSKLSAILNCLERMTYLANFGLILFQSISWNFNWQYIWYSLNIHKLKQSCSV